MTGTLMIKKLISFSTMALLLAACVTINIYFPAAAAEEAARTIVRDVLQKEEPSRDTKEQPPTGDKGSALPGLQRVGMLVLSFMNAFIPAAEAAQADININTAAIQGIRASIKRRQARLAPFYRSGAIGFDRNGSVSIRDLGAASLGDRNKIKKLVADENKDRSALYREIARANGHPEWEAEVRATFAKVWVEEALSGYWYQDSGGAWKKR